jgi:pantoate--beta-alanine ligase
VKITRTIAETRAALAGRADVGLVPTMGAYHAGHVALLSAARRESETVVASLFVNPAQFGDRADLARYPRDEAADTAVAEEQGVDVLFAPAADELYPRGFETWVDVENASRGLEGDSRPGHFRGVATICLKLFNIVRPDRAYFGQKDAQQAVVIRRVVRDLNLDVEIRVLPTVRDEDGLALSSRNARLSADERAHALALPRALAKGAEAHALGGDAVAATRAALNGLTPDYVEVLDLDGVTILASAARIGGTRLIDNVILEGELT